MRSAYRSSLHRIGLALLLIGVCLAAALPWSLPVSAEGTFTTTITPSRTSLSPGDSLTVAVLLKNETTDLCFGIPQFRLYVETTPGVWQDLDNPIFTPARPEPINQSIGLGPGDSTTATFTLTAARPGSVTFLTTVTGEATGPNCQPPYYWASAAPSRSTVVTVNSPLRYLPIVTAHLHSRGDDYQATSTLGYIGRSST